MFVRLFLLVLIFFPAVTANLSAQIIPSQADTSDYSDVRVGSHYSLLPVIAYTSDLGLIGGALVQRINYGNNIQPFLSNMQANFTFSTKGNIIADFNYERIRTFGTGIRSLIDFTGQRIWQGHYFGIGNQTEFSDDLFDDNYFFFESREISLYYQARKSIFDFGEIGRFDLTASIDFSYMNSKTRDEESKYEEDSPFGSGKSRSSKTGIGFIADSRDSEFSPARGFRYEVSYEVSSAVVGSDYTYSDVQLDMRHYLRLFDGVVLAQKMDLKSIQGDAPFWELASIGGEDGLRGYHLERFRGNQSVFHLLELRTWLLSFWDDNIKAGSQLFWDTGRVFSEYDSNPFFDNWKHSFGGGFIVSLFTPDLMFRADIGFSEETFRIYFGTGYVF